MNQNPSLLQHLSDARMADLRRDTVDRDPRTADARHDVALRVARPLRVWHRNH